ncbi:hypothetical protein [Cellulosimicrobium sp. TH-20]|uniref:hypothetical protein n=1 Tax=Cellulosimicrobium sp. TH-20 TaxID=1980001 RepID=UPI0011A40759|nr:hypothetical protein [Cellulosimicrobium sp. TH-20]
MTGSRLRRVLATLGLLCLGAAGLSACEMPESPEPAEVVDVVEVEANSGTVRLVDVPAPSGVVTCAVYDSGTAEGSGLSCDWMNARNN